MGGGGGEEERDQQKGPDRERDKKNRERAIEGDRKWVREIEIETE